MLHAASRFRVAAIFAAASQEFAAEKIKADEVFDPAVADRRIE